MDNEGWGYAYGSVNWRNIFIDAMCVFGKSQ